MEELPQTIQKMKKGNARGQDEITIEMIKALSESGFKELLKLPNDVRAVKMTPKALHIGIECPTREKGAVNDAQTIEEKPWGVQQRKYMREYWRAERKWNILWRRRNVGLERDGRHKIKSLS